MATIDITTIKKRVRSALSGEGFSLALPSLDSPTLTALANAALPAMTLHLNAAKLEEPADGKSIIVHGSGVDLPFTGMQCAARFSAPGDVASLQFSAHGDHTWLLSTAFPLLGSNLINGMRFADASPPTFYLYSDPDNDGHPAGLTFEGSLDLNAITGGLASLIGRSYQAVSGPFVLQDQGSELSSFSLTGEAATGVNLGIAKNVELSFSVGGWLGTSPYDGMVYILPYLALGAAIPFSAQGESHPIPVKLTLFDLKGDFRFETDLTGLVDAAVEEIKALTQKIGLEDLVPKGDFQLQNYLSLSNFFFDFNPTSSPPLTQIGVDVQNAHPWTIVHLADSDKDWVVEKALLSFRVTNPGQQNASRALLAGGELKIGVAGVLLLSARYPDWELDLSLKEGTTLNLTEVIEEFMGNAAGAPQVQVDAFALHVAPDGYALEVTVLDDWILANGLLAIQEVSLSLQHTSGSTQASISGTFSIANVGLVVTADHPADPRVGWKFQGQTIPGYQLAIGDLLYDLDQQFGLSTPQALQSLELDGLEVDYTTGSGVFHCICSGGFALAGGKAESFRASIELLFEPKKNQLAAYHLTATGTLVMKLANGVSEIFKLILDLTPGSKIFTAIWQESGHALGFADLAGVFGFQLPTDFPPELDLALEDAAFVYDFAQGSLVFTAASQNYGTATFANLVNQKTGTREYIFSLEADDINLAGLPLVGSKLPKDLTLGLRQLQVLVASAPLDADNVKRLNLLFAGLKAHLAHPPAMLPEGGVPSGVTLSMLVSSGDPATAQPLSLSLSGGTQTEVLSPTGGTLVPAAGPAADPTKWFAIQKAFGPVTFRRIGIRYQNSVLYGALDASLAFGGVALSLDGLALGSPLSSFKPAFHLDGLGLAVNESPLEVSGGFLAVPANPLEKVDFQYDGSVVIKAETFTLSALGSYAQANGQPSLFIFASIAGSFGGPPAFFITGFSGGFGYNRKLRIPEQNEVYQFPFVAGLSDPSAIGGPNATPLDVLAILDGRGTDKNGRPLPAWLTVQTGEDWLAAGISFTSFELIKSHALLVAEFGGDFELALIGISLLQLPQEVTDPTKLLTYVELQLEAVLKPSEGFFGISAVLSPNSFVLDRNCHLTGGFAFFIWYDGPYAGDFVVTLGGYHPAFRAPGNYPQEPLLGLNWQFSDKLTINGGAYFALTPSCVMAGGNLQILFHDGDLRAWCTAYADFLMNWKPLWYTARAGIDIGVSYKLDLFGITKTLSVDLSATANLWGPPTGGEIHVEWYIISFTIGFGPKPPEKPQPLKWQQFRSLLPAQGDVCKITANGGLQTTSQDKKTWFVRSAGFQFTTDSAIPAQEVIVRAKGKDDRIDQRSPINIRPLQSWSVASSHMVTIKRIDDGSGEIDLRGQGWMVNAHTRSVPAALWGQQIAEDVPPPSADLVANQLAGLTISVPEPTAGTTRGIVHWTPETVATASSPISSSVCPVPAPGHTDSQAVQIIQQALTDAATTNTRAAVFAALHTLGYDPGTNDPLDTLAQALPGLYRESPLVA